MGLSFEQIIAPTRRTHDASCALMQAWVDAHKADPRAARGLLWMAQLRLADHQREAARPLFQRVWRDYPGTEWALHSLKGLADLDLDGFRYGNAIAKFDALARSPSPFFQYVGHMAGLRARSMRLRFDLTLAVIAVFALVWAVRLRRLGSLRLLWPPPVEVVYPLPILVVTVAASFGPPEGEGRGALLLAIGAVALLWLNGAYFRARPPKGRWRIVHALLGLVQAAALLYVAVVMSGLWDKFYDTLEMGAD